MTRVLLGLMLLTGTALAEDRVPVRVAVGETREIEVGFARMHMCDDPAIVGAEMRDKNEKTNVFVVTGLRVGTTTCRAGLETDRPTVLFTVTVVAKPTRPAPQER